MSLLWHRLRRACIEVHHVLEIPEPNGGFEVYYALADASYYVRPQTALFGEALTRGTSYYLPGMSVPMLPKALSWGIFRGFLWGLCLWGS